MLAWQAPQNVQTAAGWFSAKQDMIGLSETTLGQNPKVLCSEKGKEKKKASPGSPKGLQRPPKWVGLIICWGLRESSQVSGGTKAHVHNKDTVDICVKKVREPLPPSFFFVQ